MRIEIFPKFFKETEPTYKNNIYYIDDSKKIQIDAGLLLDKPVDLLILTHCHIDHISKAAEIKKKTGCRIAASYETARYVRTKNKEFILGEFEPFEVDLVLENGAVIETGDFRLKILKTPGHTSSCISIYEPNKKILFSGDCWFGQDSTGRYDLPTSDKRELIQSLNTLKNLKVELLCPGHDY